MKNLTLKSFLLASLYFNSQTLLAGQGTERVGGGGLEVAFQNAITKIGDQIELYGKSAKSKLLFKYEDYLSSSLNARIRCAVSEDDKNYLKENNKLAFVKINDPKESNIIYLYCDDQKENNFELAGNWKLLFNDLINNSQSLQPRSMALVVHEVLRVAKVEIEEGDYTRSSSIIRAQEQYLKSYAEQISEMLIGKHRLCSIKIEFGECVDATSNSAGSRYAILANKFISHGIFGRSSEEIFNVCPKLELSQSGYESIIVKKGFDYEPILRLQSKLEISKCFDGR